MVKNYKKQILIFICITLLMLESFLHIFIPEAFDQSLPDISKENVIFLKADKKLIYKSADIAGFSTFQLALIRFLCPHNLVFWVEVNRERQTKTLSLSILPRRLGPVMYWMLSNSIKKQFPLFIYDTFKDKNNRWVIKTTIPIEKELILETAVSNVQTKYINENNGDLLLTNHSENLYPAVLFNNLLAKEHSNAGMTRIVEIPYLLNFLMSITNMELHANFVKNNLKVNISANCRDEIAARQTEFFLMTLRDLTYKSAMGIEYFFSGNIKRQRTFLTGEFSLTALQTMLN
jgi:hypothetical protein|tara:strand:+ start:207 stop:1076 length:870 start_codon:yes stop_codon:yes gene_type:complete